MLESEKTCTVETWFEAVVTALRRLRGEHCMSFRPEWLSVSWQQATKIEATAQTSLSSYKVLVFYSWFVPEGFIWDHFNLVHFFLVYDFLKNCFRLSLKAFITRNFYWWFPQRFLCLVCCLDCQMLLVSRPQQWLPCQTRTISCVVVITALVPSL